MQPPFATRKPAKRFAVHIVTDIHPIPHLLQGTRRTDAGADKRLVEDYVSLPDVPGIKDRLTHLSDQFRSAEPIEQLRGIVGQYGLLRFAAVRIFHVVTHLT